MTLAQRQKIQRIQAYLVWKKDQIGYIERRPMETAHISTMTQLIAHTERGFAMDCSESAVLICHVAGVKSPTGSWSIGNTETMLSRLKHYTDAKIALPGAFVVFNSDRPLGVQHVCQVHQADKLHGNPVLFTHGESQDPNFRTLAWMQTGFTGSTTFLSVAKL
jgi:hypothetical protein